MSPVRRPSAFLLVALLLTACAGGASSLEVSSASAGPSAAGGERPDVTVHRSATCACCGDYEDHLEAHGYEVIVEIHDDVTGFKDEAGVPDDVRSCHTNEVAGYLVEGHVPVAAIEDLLEQRPDVAGVALAGMPAGSPGMPGEQEEPFVKSRPSSTVRWSASSGATRPTCSAACGVRRTGSADRPSASDERGSSDRGTCNPDPAGS